MPNSFTSKVIRHNREQRSLTVKLRCSRLSATAVLPSASCAHQFNLVIRPNVFETNWQTLRIMSRRLLTPIDTIALAYYNLTAR